MSVQPLLTPTDHLINLGITCVKELLNPVGMIIIILTMLVSLTGIKMFNLSSVNEKKYQNKTLWSTTIGIDGKPKGLLFGKWFIGYVPKNNSNKWYGSNEESMVITFKKTHFLISGSEEENAKKDIVPSTFSNITREGNYSYIYYTTQAVDITSEEPRPFQREVVKQVRDLYAKKSHAVILLSGPPGCGKSNICNQLIRDFATSKIKCSLTDEFRPTEPSSFFQGIFSQADPVHNESPLIVLIDEVDGILSVIGGKGIPHHEKYLIYIKNKTEWNTFLDKFGKSYWKNVILILTTNMSLEQIDSFDTSYTRPGRVDLRFEVTHNGVLTIQRPAENGISWK